MQRIERSSSPLSWAFATFATHDSTNSRRSSSDSVSVGNAISHAVWRRVQYSRSDMSPLHALHAPHATARTSRRARGIAVVYHARARPGGRGGAGLLDRPGGA